MMMGAREPMEQIIIAGWVYVVVGVAVVAILRAPLLQEVTYNTSIRPTCWLLLLDWTQL